MDNSVQFSKIYYLHRSFCRVRVTPIFVFSEVSCVLCLPFVLFCWPWSCLSSDFTIFCLSLWYLRIPFRTRFYETDSQGLGLGLLGLVLNILGYIAKRKLFYLLSEEPL